MRMSEHFGKRRSSGIRSAGWPIIILAHFARQRADRRGDDSLSKCPGHPASISSRFNNLGTALLQNGQLDEAIVSCQKALQIKPGYAEAQYNLANAWLQKGRGDQAIIEFQKVLTIQTHSEAGSYGAELAFLWLLKPMSETRPDKCDAGGGSPKLGAGGFFPSASSASILFVRVLIHGVRREKEGQFGFRADSAKIHH